MVRCRIYAPQSLTSLGRQLALDRSAITRLTDRLVHKGLLQRRVPDGDRRIYEVLLNEPSSALVHALLPLVRRAVCRCFGGYSSRDLTTLQRLLRRLSQQTKLNHER